MKQGKHCAQLGRAGRFVSALVLFGLAWEMTARSGFFSEQLFPPLTSVLRAVLDLVLSGELAANASASLWRAYTGLAIGSLAAIAAGLLTGRSPAADQLLSPTINLLRQIPPVAIIPLMIVWCGIGDLSKVISISCAVFFPVWMSAHAGARNIVPAYFWIAQSADCHSWRRLRRVIFPAALPYILVGLRGAVATAFIMLFVSELAGASAGLGYEISVSHLAYRIDRMLAAILALAVCGAATDYGLRRMLFIMYPWLRLVNQ